MKILLSIISFLTAATLLASGQNIAGIEHLNRIQNAEEVPIPLITPLMSPAPSPDGRYLAFTRENFKGLFLFDLETGELREISNLNGSGFGFVWSRNGLLAFRGSTGKLKRKHIIGVAHDDGVVEVASTLLDDVSLPLWSGEDLGYVVWDKEPRMKTAGPYGRALFDEMVFCHPSGRPVFFDNDLKIVHSGEIRDGKVYFLPRMSRDGSRYLLHSLDGHLYLGKIGGRTLTDIGEGSGARFARNDEWVIFERTRDDGHTITSSDLYLYEIGTKATYRLTDTKEIVERTPAMAEDGFTVYWEQDGVLMKGTVR